MRAHCKKMALCDLRYLSFAGAGSSGYAYAGFLDALERAAGYDEWRRELKGVAGTSAGALAALAVVLGLDATARARVLHEILDVVAPLNMDLALLARRYGVDDGTTFRTQIQEVLEMSGLSASSTLGDLHRLLRVEFAVVCTDLSTSTQVTLSPRTHAGVRVCDAIFASCCVPFLFTPMELDGHVLVDGCLTANQPRVYDDARTLFAWTCAPSAPRAALSDLTWHDFLMGVLRCAMSAQHPQLEHLREHCAHVVLHTRAESAQSLLTLAVSNDACAAMLHAAFVSTVDWLHQGRLLRVATAAVAAITACALAPSRGCEPESEAAPNR